MNLPTLKTEDQDLSLMQSKWKSILDPIISNPANNSLVLSNLTLISGDNTINHLLGRKLQGWIVIGNSAATTFYDKQSSNQQPQLTLALHTSGACVVSLLVF